MRVLGRGHPEIRATHAKTLEFTADEDITGRATCVVAVGCRVVEGGRVAGPVRVRIEAGGATAELEAEATSGWEPSGSGVLRRGALRLPGTLATEAGATAADLPRELVAAVQDPGTEVALTVEPRAGADTAVLFALDPALADPRLAAELAAADVVVAEDEEAARLLGTRTARGAVEVRGRVLVVAAHDLPGASVAADLRGVRLDTIGLPAPLAAAAASPSRAPLYVAREGADVRDLLREVPVGHRLLVTVAADRLPELLAQAARIRGGAAGVLSRQHAAPTRVDADAVPDISGSRSVHVCFDAQPVESSALDPRVRAAMDALRADEVPTRARARALAELTGWPRRRAYDWVLAQEASTSASRPEP